MTHLPSLEDLYLTCSVSPSRRTKHSIYHYTFRTASRRATLQATPINVSQILSLDLRSVLVTCHAGGYLITQLLHSFGVRVTCVGRIFFLDALST